MSEGVNFDFQAEATGGQVESYIAELPDLIPAFMAWLSSQPIPALDVRSKLFPKAMFFPGWHHLWDNLLKSTCYEFPWFPGFLELLKGMVKVCRLVIHKDVIVAHLLAKDERPLAKQISAFQVTSGHSSDSQTSLSPPKSRVWSPSVFECFCLVRFPAIRL